MPRNLVNRLEQALAPFTIAIVAALVLAPVIDWAVRLGLRVCGW